MFDNPSLKQNCLGETDFYTFIKLCIARKHVQFIDTRKREDGDFRLFVKGLNLLKTKNLVSE